jgi:hypothetical protein
MADTLLPASRIWADRAEQYRTMAEHFQNESARERMLKVAELYQRMSVEALEREQLNSGY